MSEFLEQEYKYRADDVGLKDFQALMDNLGHVQHISISSWDYYYTKGEDNFMRYRESTTPELTIKKKIKAANNWERIEIDLPLDANRLHKGIVTQFANQLGYDENFKVYKSCFIYWQQAVNYVYYIVYNEQMKEVGRFVEVELNKKGNGMPGDLGMKLLNDAEQPLEKLGITPKNRMKKSLFELYKRDLTK